MKLQDAYFAETNNLGNWSKIGYKMGNTSNFKYTEATITNGTVEIGTGVTAGWKAENLAALNDCKVGGYWQIDAKGNNDKGGSVEYTAKVATTDCEALTSSFGKLDKTGAASVINSGS